MAAQSIISGATPPGVPHLAIPFEVGADGTVATVEQDSPAEVVQSVANLVGTRPGTRLMVPEYGVEDPNFLGLDQNALAHAVASWEPRAQVNVAVTPGNLTQIVVEVKTEVSP